MQYKNVTKIVIDKRKLDILIRLGCSDDILINYIKTGKFTKTGDSLVDDILESLIDFKNFDNWGGKRAGSGRPKNQVKNQLENQLENQIDIQNKNQKDNQNIIQLADKDIDKDKEKVKRFVKPTIEEIKSYCLERKNTVNAEKFFDFYESKGWKVGNQAMKDWRAAVRTWERSSSQKSSLYDKCVQNGLRFLEGFDD